MATGPQRHIDYSGLELDTREAASGRGIEVYNFEDLPQPVRQNANYSTLPEASQPLSRDTGQIYPWPSSKNQHEDPSRGLPPSRTCGIPTKRFYIYVGVALVIVVVALAVGLGTSFGIHSGNGASKSSSSAAVSNMSIAALHWVDVDNLSQYRVYAQAENQSKVLQSSSSSDNQNWTVSTITSANANVQLGTPLTAIVGYYNTDLNTLVCHIPPLSRKYVPAN